MTDATDTMLNHRTYRQFDPDFRLPESDVNLITDCAQKAPSWMNGQHYSIVRVSSEQLRRQIVALQPGNPQIGQCSEFFVFVGDLYRAKLSSDAFSGSFEALGTPDTVLTMTVDAAMAAQNAITAAESLGYAICPVGGLRLIAPQLVQLLNLPAHTFPLFGLCIGKAAVEMRSKPRLPREAVVFENAYDAARLPALLENYERTMTQFAEARERLPYREKFARYYEKTYAPDNIPLLRQQGFLTKFS